MFLSKILILSCMIIFYIVEENICAVELVSLLYRRNIEKHIKNCFKVNCKQRIIMSEKGKYVKFRNYKRKIVITYNLRRF